jgi:hypothetical protein
MCTKQVHIESVEKEFREATAIDLKHQLPFIIDIPQKYPIADIEAGKSYVVILKIYKSDTVLRSRAPDSQIALMSSPLKFKLVGLKPCKAA